ncbi:hypothetical protein BJX61DRAFT_536878 [Aspergillus egyptiacus]|nr:hypothetical protein BJX61DRAFT_536878 [Aspergillus egyptiacus]
MTEPAAAVRRNGLQQSCEPCRKSKLKCDHRRPVCGRCMAKQITQRCFYHPAPMTKPDTSSRGRLAKRMRTESTHISRSRSPALEYSTGLHITSEPPPVNPGYLGSTSFSAVFSENRKDISVEEDSSVVAGQFGTLKDRVRCLSGLEVLKFLYRNTICDTLIRKFYDGHCISGVPRTILEAILQSVRRIFQALDRSKDNNDIGTQLQDLVYQIFRSSARPLTSHSAMTVEEYCASFTDKNMRWEAIGLILATAGLALMSTSESDPDLTRVASDSQARHMIRAQAVEASNICLGFCDTSASVNELLGFYQYNDMLLRTQYYGDASYIAWRRLGDLTATIFAAGLHQESTRAQDCPPFLHQWRRGCFAAAFYADKCLSTFVGRPPFINHRYCSLIPPLDLSDDDLIAGGERLSEALSDVGATGWNSHGQHQRVSMMRLRFLLAVLREQALEIALGTSTDSDILQGYNKVIEAARQTWETCPVWLRYKQNDDSKEMSSAMVSAKRHNYLEYLYTLFIVQRMVVKRTNTGHEDLFETSREILAITVGIANERHSTVDISIHQSWLVLYYGLPSASILAFELLRRTQEAGPHPAMPPQAELIRNLSVFVSSLSWVARPGQGNYRTCKAVEKKLSEILDQILDPQPAQRDFLNGSHTGLYSMVNWYSPENYNFNPFDFPSQESFPF